MEIYSREAPEKYIKNCVVNRLDHPIRTLVENSYEKLSIFFTNFNT